MRDALQQGLMNRYCHTNIDFATDDVLVKDKSGTLCRIPRAVLDVLAECAERHAATMYQ